MYRDKQSDTYTNINTNISDKIIIFRGECKTGSKRLIFRSPRYRYIWSKKITGKISATLTEQKNEKKKEFILKKQVQNRGFL